MARIYGEIASSALMTFDKSFSRSNGQPLDSTEVFYSLAAAQDYAKTDVAYVGQKIVVLETNDGVTTVTHYGIEADNSLKELGAIPVGDGLTIEIVNGKVQLAAIGEHTSGTYQPFLVDGKIEWREPSETTVEGLDNRLQSVEGDITAIESVVGDETSGLVKGVADNAAAIEAVEIKIGDVADGKTIVEMIADAKAEATYDDSDLSGRVTFIEDDYLTATDKTELADDIAENKTAIDTLNADSETVGSVDYKIAQAVAAIMENPDETMNSINELVTWVNEHAESALELSNQVTTNKNDIAALVELVGTDGVQDQITTAISEALTIDGVDKYALAVDLTNAIARVAALEGKEHEHANKDVIDGITAEKVSAWDAAEQAAKDYADGLNTAMDTRVGEAEVAIAGKVDAETGKSLVSDELIAKLDGVEAGAQVNVIDSVDETQFAIDESKKLTLLDVAMGKVAGLQTVLDEKANKGTTLAAYGITDAYTKEETLDKIAEKITEINGGESAGEVLSQLNSYKETNNDRINTIEGKLANIAEGAQVNVIEGVKVGDTVLEIVDKIVTIPVGAGLKASDEITIAADGTLGVGEVGVGKLVDDGTTLILNGGAAV